MANPGDFAYLVKQQADIVRIVGEYMTLRKSGAQNFQGLCPFHQEKTPSFSVHASRQFFHCFGCGASGDVFSFVQKIENITFPEAVRLLAEKLKIPLPKMSYSSPEEERQAGMRVGLIEIHERACKFFQEQLRRSEAAHAREYLASRGIAPEITAEFRMGYAPESGFLLRDVLRGQYDEALLRESGLFSWKDKGDEAADQNAVLYSKFRNRVMFPITNESGKVIAFTGRTLASDEKSGPKYLNSPETPIYSKSRVLFNLDKAKEPIRKLEYAILVEGQMDCISVYTAGFRNVIASSGTAFTELQARLLGSFSKNIVVNFDPDTAGAAAAERSLGLIDAERVLIRALASQELSHSAASDREGQDLDFEPARQAHFALSRERLHGGSAAESLIDFLLLAQEQGLDPMSLPLEEGARSLLATVLMDEHEDLTPELLESSIRSLRRRVFRRQLEDLQQQLKEAERQQDSALAARLLQERLSLRRAMSTMGEGA